MAGTQTATVLVTDLVGSTELRTRLGEERADQFRRRHDGLLSGAIADHGGTVIKGLGDGLLAIFPSAADGIAAAVAVQQAVDAEWGRVAELTAAIRIGLSVGDVTLEDGDSFGSPVVEASRLCAAAEGGQILVAELVRLLARGRGDHTFAEVGALELKGLPEPVLTFAVEWASIADTDAIPVPGALRTNGIALVGRDVELDQIMRAWKSASEGERRVTLLAGEPGIGKTRLSAEVARRAAADGGVVLYGRCDEGMGVAYQPFVEALAEVVAAGDADAMRQRLGEHPGELVRLVPDLASRLPDLEPALQSDAETERYRLFDAVASWLTATAQTSGVVLVLDDVHWAEKPTLLLLRHLIKSTDPMRLLVVATYRDTELDRTHPLASLLADFRREPGTERIALSGLDVDGVEAMILATAQNNIDDRVGQVARVVWQETEGNPFFVAEVLRSLVESGAVFQRDGQWTTDLAVEDLPIPEGVREVIGRRLGRVSQDANLVLSVASVAGAEFDLDVLVAVSGLDEDAVLDALDTAVDAHLVDEAGVGHWRFAHALVRSTLYEELSVTRRARRHRQVADYLEGHRLDDAATLAFHYAHAGGGGAHATEKAILYAAAAGRAALERLAPDQAAEFFVQALDLLDDAGDPGGAQRAELLIGLGMAQRDAADPAFRDTLLDAAHLAQQLGDPSALARAAVENTRGFVSFIGMADEDRIAVLESAYAALPVEDSPLRARVCATLASELIFSPAREAQRFDIADEAVAIARRLGDARTFAEVVLQALLPGFVPDRFAATCVLAEELREAADVVGDPRLQLAEALWSYGSALSAADPVLDDHIDRALKVAEENHVPAMRFLAVTFDVGRSALHGNLQGNEELGAAAYELGLASGQPDAVVFGSAQIALLRLEQDRVGEIVDAVLGFADVYPHMPGWRAAGAMSLALSGRVEEATTIIDELARDDFAAIPNDYLWLLAMRNLVEACVLCGDAKNVETLHRLVAPFEDQLCHGWCWAASSVARVLGQAETLLGRYSDAERHFAKALEVHERIGQDHYVAYTRLDWAQLLLTRGGDGDRERALSLIEEARAVADRRGYPVAQRRAAELLANA